MDELRRLAAAAPPTIFEKIIDNLIFTLPIIITIFLAFIFLQKWKHELKEQRNKDQVPKSSGEDKTSIIKFIRLEVVATLVIVTVFAQVFLFIAETEKYERRMTDEIHEIIQTNYSDIVELKLTSSVEIKDIGEQAGAKHSDSMFIKLKKALESSLATRVSYTVNTTDGISTKYVDKSEKEILYTYDEVPRVEEGYYAVNAEAKKLIDRIMGRKVDSLLEKSNKPGDVVRFIIPEDETD